MRVLVRLDPLGLGPEAARRQRRQDHHDHPGRAHLDQHAGPPRNASRNRPRDGFDEAEDADGFKGALEDDEVANPYEEDDPVGRLADDENSDLNDRSFAQDVGMAGGGSSAEESAMHIVGDEDQEVDF